MENDLQVAATVYVNWTGGNGIYGDGIYGFGVIEYIHGNDIHVKMKNRWGYYIINQVPRYSVTKFD
jgi:hypothetical protein